MAFWACSHWTRVPRKARSAGQGDSKPIGAGAVEPMKCPAPWQDGLASRGHAQSKEPLVLCRQKVRWLSEPAHLRGTLLDTYSNKAQHSPLNFVHSCFLTWPQGSHWCQKKYTELFSVQTERDTEFVFYITFFFSVSTLFSLLCSTPPSPRNSGCGSLSCDFSHNFKLKFVLGTHVF